jgi:hypothetical protein
MVNRRNQVADCQFEDTAAWAPALEDAIIDVGTQLLAAYQHIQGSIHPNEQYFPLAVIMEELEDISAALSASGYPLGKGWAARLCIRLRVSTALIMSNYLQLLDKCVGQRPEKIVQVIASVSFVVLHWVNGVYRYVNLLDIFVQFIVYLPCLLCSREPITEFDRTELIRTARSGEFHSWLERIKRQANLMCGSSGTRLSAQKMDRLREALAEVDQAGKRMQEMIVVM